MPFTSEYPNKLILLDRDGVINRELGDYVKSKEDFIIEPGVPEALKKLKDNGYYLAVVTNQGGISRGIYQRALVDWCHNHIQEVTGGMIDAFYYSPWHKTTSRSLAAKPQRMMLERALHRFKCLPKNTWMVGDADRDLQAALSLGIEGILIKGLKQKESAFTHRVASSLQDAVERFILPQ